MVTDKMMKILQRALQSRFLEIPKSGGRATPVTKIHVHVARQLNYLRGEKGGNSVTIPSSKLFLQIKRHLSGLERQLSS